MKTEERSEQQNVTISLPVELVREARHLAMDRGVSLSRFLALLLEEEIEARRRNRATKDRQPPLLTTGHAREHLVDAVQAP